MSFLGQFWFQPGKPKKLSQNGENLILQIDNGSILEKASLELKFNTKVKYNLVSSQTSFILKSKLFRTT